MNSKFVQRKVGLKCKSSPSRFFFSLEESGIINRTQQAENKSWFSSTVQKQCLCPVCFIWIQLTEELKHKMLN